MGTIPPASCGETEALRDGVTCSASPAGKGQRGRIRIQACWSSSTSLTRILPGNPQARGEWRRGEAWDLPVHSLCDLKHSLSPSLLRGNAVGQVGAMTQRSQYSSLSPLAEKSIPLRILYDKYCECLTESNLIKVRGLLIEPAANSYLLAERDIYLENPEIKIRVRDGLGERWWQGRGPRTARPHPTHVPTSSPAPPDL